MGSKGVLGQIGIGHSIDHLDAASLLLEIALMGTNFSASFSYLMGEGKQNEILVIKCNLIAGINVCSRVDSYSQDSKDIHCLNGK